MLLLAACVLYERGIADYLWSFQEVVALHHYPAYHFFRDDIQQYRLLPDYVFKLRQNDHDVILKMEDKQFNRIQIVFREGKQVFKS
uniref:AlNc14C171G7995 protein n=1 Tax=Albugo laibachii Nc14 TaxID=890382 RepID=F0WNH0_9STRA|nr:AlNc14C171G7995 [Albugo laibachii Nc14]|eukprot:CCA22861.1 AlNc14C171G7995 [Albugo laibachii Nc14]